MTNVSRSLARDVRLAKKYKNCDHKYGASFQKGRFRMKRCSKCGKHIVVTRWD